jgi:hypothetical protein
LTRVLLGISISYPFRFAEKQLRVIRPDIVCMCADIAVVSGRLTSQAERPTFVDLRGQSRLETCRTAMQCFRCGAREEKKQSSL